MNYKLVFDLGYYDGRSTLNFLESGFKVIGVECNPNMLNRCQILYKQYIDEERLILIDKAISNVDDSTIPFYINNVNKEWSSCLKKIPTRINDDDVEKILVKTITLKSMIKKYGCPYFCKIDIEGYDIIALKSLIGEKELPKYIQAESECIGDEDPDKIDFLEILNTLRDLGYTKFAFERGSNTANFQPEGLRYQNYDSIKELIIHTRYNFNFLQPWFFWFDIIATY